MSVPPCRLREVLKAKPWGGTRLAERFGKALPAGARIGESWEAADVGDDISTIADGPWAGRTLRALAADAPAALYGPGRLPPERFPLLVKFIDAREPLSIQVHPDDATAARLGAPSGKAEAWVVVDATPGATLWRGVRPGITRAALGALAEAGRTVEALHAIPAAPGDAVYVAPGIVHAIGAGCLLYEVQQAADVTYRLDDWGRVGADGRPRPLQRTEALASLDLTQPCLDKRIPARLRPGDELLVACEKFTLRRLTAAVTEDAARLGAHVLTCIAGGGRLAGAFGTRDLAAGQTWLVPHGTGAYRWEPAPGAILLCASSPALGTVARGSTTPG